MLRKRFDRRWEQYYKLIHKIYTNTTFSIVWIKYYLHIVFIKIYQFFSRYNSIVNYGLLEQYSKLILFNCIFITNLKTDWLTYLVIHAYSILYFNHDFFHRVKDFALLAEIQAHISKALNKQQHVLEIFLM